MGISNPSQVAVVGRRCGPLQRDGVELGPLLQGQLPLSPAVLDVVQVFRDDGRLAGEVGVVGDDGDGLPEALEGRGRAGAHFL
jgi:hypothetical protein